MEEEEEDSEEEILLFLWEEHLPIFELFKLIRVYFLTDYAVDTALLVYLIEKNKLPLEETLYHIAYLRAGYLETLLPGTRK